MGLEAAISSRMAITSTPNLRHLTLSLPTTSWSSPFDSKFNSARKDQLSKLTSRAAVALSSDAKAANRNGWKVPTKREGDPKRLSSSASQRVVLDYYQILRYPLITDLTMKLMIENNTLTFVVDKHAEKDSIKAAAKKMFKVETRKVNTLMVPGGRKKAYLMLKPEHNALEIAKKIKII